MYFFSAQMNHKMLAVLCSVQLGRGWCRRFVWCNPVCAERHRWMCSGFGMHGCGWVIGHCERPQVKILRWEWGAFIYTYRPSIPPSPPAPPSHSCYDSLFPYHLNSLSPLKHFLSVLVSVLIHIFNLFCFCFFLVMTLQSCHFNPLNFVIHLLPDCK